MDSQVNSFRSLILMLKQPNVTFQGNLLFITKMSYLKKKYFLNVSQLNFLFKLSYQQKICFKKIELVKLFFIREVIEFHLFQFNLLVVEVPFVK